MSTCGEFAEHVWKPGSCKNCFHPRSAHTTSTVPSCYRTSVGGGEENDCVTLPSPYSKPIIAVRPTMMSSESSEMEANDGMNAEKENDKRLQLKKVVDVAPLCVDSNICSSVRKETIFHNVIPGNTDYSSSFSSGALTQKDSRIIRSTFETQDDSLGPQTLMENVSSTSYRPQIDRVKCTFTSKKQQQQEFSSPLGIEINIITAYPSDYTSYPTNELSTTFPSPTLSPNSRHASLSDSCSFCSSTDSVTVPANFYQIDPESTQNGPISPEPIYAESTKRKRKPQRERKEQLREQSDIEVEPEVKAGDSQRATITVMAAHTEKNNRTFYLSSPDSAVSTQWPYLSPTALQDPCSPTFKWPTPSFSMETPSSDLLKPKSQCSPPLPPKRNTRSPVPLPDLSFISVSTVGKSHHYNTLCTDHLAGNAMERRHKLSSNTWTPEVRIEEEEETEAEKWVADKVRLSDHPANGTSVCKEYNCSSSMQGEGTTYNSASQEQAAVRVMQGSYSGSGSMLVTGTTAASLIHVHDLAKGKVNRETTPPPPPPKKQNRPCPKMSQSSVELDKVSQQGSVDSLTQSLRELGNSLSTSSTPLQPDTCGLDGTKKLCPSLVSTNPLVTTASSPNFEPYPSNSLGQQLQPPPLPEKKLVNRTVSAPGETGGGVTMRGRPRLPFYKSEDNVCGPDGAPSSPVDARPLYSSSDCLENCPLPLNRPLRSCIVEEARLGVVGRLGSHSRGSVTTASSPQLSCPAPSGSTLQLQTLLSNMDSREGIYSKLGGLYAESLRRLAIKCEDHFTRNQGNTLRFHESNWSLFKLTCNKPSCQAGDAIYYSASCASDASKPYAVKICKSTSSDSKQGHLYGLSIQQSLPPHFNLQQDCGHFIACVPQSMLPSEELPAASSLSTMVSSPGQSEQEHVVVITNEVPYQSASDFVREWISFHKAQPEVYERRICFLLLQLCNGLEHLKACGVTHRDLCLENLLLVPHRQAGCALDTQQQQLPRLIISNFTKAKQRSTEGPTKTDPRLKRDHARLAPEIVSAVQYRKFDEFQVGILIYELLHQPNPFELSPALKEQEYCCEDLPPIPGVSLYSSGLQRLAGLLLQSDPIKRIHIQDAKRVLQSLLWGPRRDMMEQHCKSSRGQHEGLLNWLDVKRALLMMKFAERSLEPERNAELEDWLCCQYFSTAHPLSLCHTAELLYSFKVTH
ncbi:inactive tyrosine-protein kinase PRAG1 [Alosa pseudoharengus]|uniref:inactive tyrosine-protein kinase PRAG1 n=1 Tax=Alosa pseudoharengus TaxID=34774 RepID=UPI003F8B22C9